MGSLDNWSSDEGDGTMDRSSRSRRSRGKSPSRTLGRSVSILSNLSEMSESIVFGARWHLDEATPRRGFSSRRIDDDWFDDPSDDLGVSARSSTKSSTVGGSRASGSDESERPQRRRSISKSPTLYFCCIGFDDSNTFHSFRFSQYRSSFLFSAVAGIFLS
ncbi:hypothetical protein V8C44DRAFT_323360 [Trichoderma aethiopicum]